MSNFVQIKQRHLNKHERTSCFSNSQEKVCTQIQRNRMNGKGKNIFPQIVAVRRIPNVQPSSRCISGGNWLPILFNFQNKCMTCVFYLQQNRKESLLFLILSVQTFY